MTHFILSHKLFLIVNSEAKGRKFWSIGKGCLLLNLCFGNYLGCEVNIIVGNLVRYFSFILFIFFVVVPVSVSVN